MVLGRFGLFWLVACFSNYGTMDLRRKKRFDIGLYQKLSKRMKEDRVHTRAKEKVEKENQVKELKKTTEKLTNQIA